MTVSGKITIYEIDGSEADKVPAPNLIVESHWSQRDKVVVHFGKQKVTVAADDLQAAITACGCARR